MGVNKVRLAHVMPLIMLYGNLCKMRVPKSFLNKAQRSSTSNFFAPTIQMDLVFYGRASTGSSYNPDLQTKQTVFLELYLSTAQTKMFQQGLIDPV
jgi:hypothetical protein